MAISKGDRIFGIVNACLLVLISILCVYPLYYVLVASFSEPIRLVSHRGLLLYPLGISFRGYELVFQHPRLLISYRNTILYVITITCWGLFWNSLGAYVLSRRNLKLLRYLMKYLIVTMFISGGLIPSYLLIRSLGILQTPLALIIPSAFSVWNMILLRTAYYSVPIELEESARIDGASDLYVLFHILIPLSKATLAVLALLTAVGVWNDWFGPMVYLGSNVEAYPLSLVLREVLITNTLDLSVSANRSITAMQKEQYKRLVQYAIVIVSTLPILCLYPFLQRYFVKGIMLGSLKG